MRCNDKYAAIKLVCSHERCFPHCYVRFGRFGINSQNLKLNLPGVQVWNAEFRQQMVHQCSLCRKGLTLRHFVVPSTSVERARVINWKSVCTALCCCVQCVEIYTKQRAFEDGINFLFSFEENCCCIILTTSRSLWWTCSIARKIRANDDFGVSKVVTTKL